MPSRLRRLTYLQDQLVKKQPPEASRLATPATAALACTAIIYKDQRFGDHAPVAIDYDLAMA